MERALDTRCTTPLTLERLTEVLLDDPGAVLATVDEGDTPPGLFVTELAVRVGEAQTVRQQVVLQLEAPRITPEAVRWPILWHPVSHERLLPEFHGSLVARRVAGGTELVLEGSYRPPLGRLGKFGDGVIGHRVARSTTGTFLSDLARRIAAEAERRHGSASAASSA